MKRGIYTLGILLVSGATTVMAQPPGERGEGGPGGPPRGGEGGRRPNPIMEALDADHNGTISADELKNSATALATLDKNEDGSLTEDEFRPQPGPPREGGPEGGGRRGEGGPKGGRPPREGGPGSGPGSGRPGEGGPHGGRQPREGGPGGPGGERGPGVNPERMLSHALEFDADSDGKLSKDELEKFIDDFVKMHPGPGPGGPGEGGGPGRGGPERGGPERGGPGGGERPDRPQRPE